MKRNPQLTLLDLVLQDPEEQTIINTRRSQPSAYRHRYNPLGISLIYEANCQTQEPYITHSTFQQVLQSIEDKLYEFERRLDNKDQFLNITRQTRAGHAPKQQSISEKSNNESQFPGQDYVQENIKGPESTGGRFHRPQRSRSSCSQHTNQDGGEQKKTRTEEGMHARMNNFEKRISQFHETIQKLQSQTDHFFKQMEAKFQQAIRDGELQLSQNQRSLKEYTQQYSSTQGTQQEILSQIHFLKQQILIYQNTLEQVQENQEAPITQLEQTIRMINKLQNSHNEEILMVQERLGGLENDLLQLLKNYKDLLLNPRDID